MPSSRTCECVWCWKPFVAALCFVMFASLASAQVRGTIEGAVVDSSAAAVPGATVEVRDPSTSQARTATSDAQGRFVFSGLPPGAYDLRVELSGFRSYLQTGIVLAVGATVRLTIPIAPAAVAETVTVTAQPPPLDASQTAVVSVIDPERIEELPVRSRNYLEFALLAPGIAPAAPQPATGPSAAIVTSGFSFGGLRPTANTLTIDGLDNNDAYTGGGRTELSLELVREFQVVTQGWSVENAGAAGGAINVVTKSGANITHGDAFLFAENGALNASPPLENTGGRKPSLQRYRAGLAAGGPIRKDRTFYYAAVEQEETRGEAASDIDAPTVDAINARLGARSPVRLTTGLFPTSVSENEWSGSVTATVSPRNALRIRASGTRNSNTADAFNTGGLTDLSARGTRTTSDVGATGSWTASIGARTTNELRTQVASRRIEQHTVSEGTPGVIVEGVAEFGTPAVPLGTVDELYTELADTVAFARGQHLVRTGGELRRIGVTSSMVEERSGLTLFRDMAAFDENTPEQVRVSIGESARDVNTLHAGVFIQDRWSVSSSITVDAGLRVDSSAFPSALGVSQRQIEPRAGIAWTPAPHWVVRAGAGRFMDRLPLVALDRAVARNGSNGWEEIHDSSEPAPVPPSIYTVRAGESNAASTQASAGVERQLSADTTVSATYLYVRGTDLSRTVNVNASDASGGRLNPLLGDTFELQPTASSTYHGLAMRLNRRLSHEIEWAVAYTLSKTTDDASAFDEQPQLTTAPRLDRGPSRYDQRHRLVASALFDLPAGDEDDETARASAGPLTRIFNNIELAPIVTIGSGTPVNAITGTDPFLTHAYPLSARPPGWTRNALRLPSGATVDLRVLKFFPLTAHGKLDLVVEAFNLLNRTNVTALNPVFGATAAARASFGQPIDASAARQIQFSIDFEF